MVKYIKGFMDYRFLLKELVKKGIRLKYRRSYLGIVWSLIEPLLTTIVLVIVFGTILKHKEADYPLYIITGRLIYTCYSSASKGALSSIRKNAPMIKKVYVPKYLYPLADVIYNFIIFAISLLVLVLVDIYCGIVPTWRIVYWIPALIILFLFSLGSGLVLGTLHVFFRDIEYLWNVALMLIMYMSAIFYYPENLLESNYAAVLKLNPLFHIITMCRNGLMGKPLDMFGFWYSLIFSISTVVIGLFIFKKKQDDFILHI